MMRLNFLEAEWVRLRAHMATTLQRPPMDRWSRSTSHGNVLPDATCLRLARWPFRDLPADFAPGVLVLTRRLARSIHRHFETEEADPGI